jgi:hypothetical protein
MMDGDVSGSSTWLAGTGELQELYDTNVTPQNPAAARFQPPPPPPTDDAVVQLEAALLEHGVFVAVPDESSGSVFYVDLVTGFRTWAMHALCQVQYYELRERLSVDASSLTTEPRASDNHQRRKSSATPTKKGGDSLPSPRSAPLHPTQASSLRSPAHWRYKIVELYNTHDPSKVPLVDELLGRYYGQEEELWANLQAKYNSPKGKLSATTPSRGRLSPRPQQVVPPPERDDVEEYVNEHDAYMHRHHGDTHGVSYRSSSGGSGSSPPSAQRRKPPQPSLGPQARHLRQSRHQSRREAAPRATLPPDLIDHVATPDVSTIGAESDAEMEEHRRLLAEARAFAEAKAARVLESAADQKQRLKKREAQRNDAAPDSTPATVGKQLWSHEVSRREEQAAAKRAAINHERERTKARREEDLRRRADELKRVRERELQLRSQESELAVVRHSTPRRHQDPTTVRSPDSVRRASPMMADASPRTTRGGSKDGHRLDSTRAVASSPMTAGTGDDATPSRKLSAREMRSSVERLYAGQRR